MSLETRITALAQKLGADVKGLLASVAAKLDSSAVTSLGRTLVSQTTAEGMAGVVGAVPLGSAGFRNLLINGDMRINQRGFGGGAVATSNPGAFFYDRWRADNNKTATITASNGSISHNSGAIVQVIENPNIGGKYMTVSVEDLTGGALSIEASGSNINGGAASYIATGAISPGSGRRGVTLQLPSDAVGNIWIRITPTSAVTYKRIQAEIGKVATEWEQRPLGIELLLCYRYFQVFSVGKNYIFITYIPNGDTRGRIPFPVPMRAAPSVSLSSNLSCIGFGKDGEVINVEVVPYVAEVSWSSFAININAPGFSGLGQLFIWGAANGFSVGLNAEIF